MSYNCPTCGYFVSDFAGAHVCQGYRTLLQGFTTNTVTTYVDAIQVERIATALEAIAKALSPVKRRAKKRV